MASDTQRITVRIPNDMADELEELIESDEFTSMSEAIRTAIREFIKSRNAPEHISKVTVDFPKKKVKEIEDLVREGDSISVDDAIRTAVRDYVKEKIQKYKEKLEEE